MECRYSLRTFGIPVSLIPVKVGGEPITGQHIERLEKRRRREGQASSRVGWVDVPGSFDVLMGKGRSLQEHHGNLEFRRLIDAYSSKYYAAAKPEKKAITEKIVEMVKKSTGRFLKDDGDGYAEVTDDIARYKVSHCFRDQKRYKNTPKTRRKSIKG
jgi:hypothetical protein